MKEQVNIFKKELLDAYLAKYSEIQIDDFESKWNTIKKWKKSCETGDLNRTKETSIQGLFFSQIFNQILGYKTVIDGGVYNQMQEFKSTLDGSEADGALGFFNPANKLRDIRVAIELKGATVPLDKKQHRTSHLTPVEQGMAYANKNGSKCGWVIVSNFIETRLYKSDSSLEYEVFDIRKMDEKSEFLRFYFMLSCEHLIASEGKSLLDELYQENEEIGVKISNQFYKEYKEIRNNLYKHLKEENPKVNDLMLFTKSQKIMDRFTFICFCEDCGLLPQNIYKQVVETSEHRFSFSQTKIWDELRGLFKAIDEGNPPMKINRYNGGLFKEDSDLDNLIIHDEVLKSFLSLSNYNFSSDLNVNILGQIFEQSISDVEQIKNEINGIESDSKGKQKEDGIFYTPYYVTRYIVEQTLGSYLSEAKENLKHSFFKSGSFTTEVIKGETGRKNTIKLSCWEDVPVLSENATANEKMHFDAVCNLHLEYWNSYENVLRNIKICDPSCGSGAFLNQCFDYLHEEMDFMLDMKRQFQGQISFFDIDKEILQNNLYGVDINPESVEITKLSLWLKTAKSNQTLATLDDNIKCGNSIVDSEDIAGALAFNWEKEFPEVFANGGFDIVAGNPPYGATVDKQEKEYILKKYETAEGNFDTYRIFFELGFSILKQNGYLGYITPNTYFDLQRSGTKLRKFLFNYTLRKIVEVYNVFPNAVVEPVISIYQKKYDIHQPLEIILVPRNTKLSSTFISDGESHFKSQADLRKNEDYIFIYKIDEVNERIFNSINDKSVALSEYYFVYNGAKPYEVGKGTPPQTKEMMKGRIYNGYCKTDDTWIPYMRGKRIKRFTSMWDGEYIKYGENLAAARSPEIFFREKVFVRQTGDSIIATLDNGNVSNDTLHIVFSKDDNTVSNKYILGLLNSTLLSWIYQVSHPLEVGKPMAQVKKAFVENLPLIIADKKGQLYIETVVNNLLTLCQKKHVEMQKFLNYISEVYEPKKISERLESFESLSFKEFLDELKKQKVKLTASQQMDLMPLYATKRQSLENISAEIKEIHMQLDMKVFDIYGLSVAEVDIISKSINIDL